MSSQDISSPSSDIEKQTEQDRITLPVPPQGPGDQGRLLDRLPPFWHDRLVEAGLIVSLGLYYIVGNSNLGSARLFHVNPLYSLPFLLIFAVLCWYRLSFAVALLPLTLPYYLLQKTVYSHYAFSPAEIAVVVCVGIAFSQLLIQQRNWRYWLSWKELRERLGPFPIPIIVFFLAAGVSVVIAYDRHVALRAFREEIVEPLLYLLLALACLRTRQDVIRLLAALFGTGLLVAILGIGQYLLFRNHIALETNGTQRVYAVYSGANDVGVLFDYTLPIGLAMLVGSLWRPVGIFRSWWFRLAALLLCLPLLVVLYLSQSRGGWVAITFAVIFIIAFAIRSRKVLLIGGLLLVLVAGGTALAFHSQITRLLIEGHTNIHGVSTVTKRLYLWQSALHMIHDSPVVGYGLDNWLCHYSKNTICDAHGFHYWITNDPVTGQPTGIADEPTLAQPHNDILNIWVNIGIFGLLTFVALVVLFFRTFARIIRWLRRVNIEGSFALQWMAIGVGAAMLAAGVQSMVDSAFLGQDFSFLFWMLIASMLLLRLLAGAPWRGRIATAPTP